MQRWNGTIQDANGRSVSNATITVYTAGVLNPLPVIYQASGSKTAPSTQLNPMSSDALGNYAFAAPDGTYDIQISGGGISTKTLTNVNFFDGGIVYPSPALGTVTSVSLTTPALFSVAGSPVTGVGTLALNYATQVKNTFLAGPAAGADAAPTMRALVTGDLPAIGTLGTKGDATHVPVFVTDVTGRVTSSTDTLITPAFASLTAVPTTLAGYGITDGASLGVANAWTKAQNVTAVALSGTNVTPDASLSNVFEWTLTANSTLNNPTNLVSGSTMTIIIKQGGPIGYTLTYGALYAFPGAVHQDPDATVSSISALFCQYSLANTLLLCNFGKKYGHA
jgi:hypothetical protein